MGVQRCETEDFPYGSITDDSHSGKTGSHCKGNKTSSGKTSDPLRARRRQMKGRRLEKGIASPLGKVADGPEKGGPTSRFSDFSFFDTRL